MRQAVLVPGLVLGLLSCSSGPTAPEKGTPAFYWQAAKETAAAGEYSKTLDHLAKIGKSENEFKTKAQVWQLVLTAGMAKGYMELADAFEHGARNNKANAIPLRRQTGAMRTNANSLALMTAEGFAAFQEKNKDAEIVLAFPFPSASAGMVPQIAKAGQGLVLPAEEIEAGLKNNLKRAVLMQTCLAAGAKDDIAKTQALFQAGEVKVPRGVFSMAMASALYDEALLYGEMKLNIPDRTKLMLEKAAEAVKAAPDSKESKELAKKIEEGLKKMKK